MNTEKKLQIESLVRDAREKAGFTGAWLYAENGEILSKGAAGYCDPDDRVPLREDCLFDLASVTKQFTAAAVMLLRRRGLLDLEDEITSFFPEIPYKGVTVRHLLTHTGGLPDYMDWYDALWKKENRIPHNKTIVRFLCECGEEAAFAPGEKWEYSNTGYCLLAQIVEQTAGVPFEDFLRDNLFEPAGMKATRVYHRRLDGITVPDLAYGLSLPLGERRYRLPDDLPEESAVVSCDGANGDGLVHSNVTDLFAWDRALRAETVLTKEEQALMYTPAKLNNGEIAEADEESKDGYGFGWGVEQHDALGLIVSHSGGWPGYSLWYERFVDADRVLILLRCRDVTDERAYGAFFDSMRALAKDEDPGPVRSIEELALPDPDETGWDALTGTYDYQIGDFCIHEIFRREGTLYAKASYKEKAVLLRLYPLEEGVFGVKDLDGDIRLSEEGLTLYGVTGAKTGEVTI